jgi:hypothetical protein
MNNHIIEDLEVQIASAFRRIPFSITSNTWVESDELDAFIGAWNSLSQAYRLNDTNPRAIYISVYIVNYLLRAVKLLNRIELQSALVHERTTASEKAEELMFAMDKLTSASINAMEANKKNSQSESSNDGL